MTNTTQAGSKLKKEEVRDLLNADKFKWNASDIKTETATNTKSS